MNKERVAAPNKEREVVNKEREEWNPPPPNRLRERNRGKNNGN